MARMNAAGLPVLEQRVDAIGARLKRLAELAEIVEPQPAMVLRQVCTELAGLSYELATALGSAVQYLADEARP